MVAWDHVLVTVHVPWTQDRAFLESQHPSVSLVLPTLWHCTSFVFYFKERNCTSYLPLEISPTLYPQLHNCRSAVHLCSLWLSGELHNSCFLNSHAAVFCQNDLPKVWAGHFSALNLTSIHCFQEKPELSSVSCEFAHNLSLAYLYLLISISLQEYL